jgi:hypothetical protein
MWIRTSGPDLRLTVDADGRTVRGRCVIGFGANYPLTGQRVLSR